MRDTLNLMMKDLLHVHEISTPVMAIWDFGKDFQLAQCERSLQMQ